MAHLTEIHTTDLSASCAKSVELRINGKRECSMTTALYVGQLFHAAARIWHEERVESFEGCVLLAAEHVEADALAEGRPLTDAVRNDRQIHMAQVCKWLTTYAAAFHAMFPRAMVVCEVPIRCTFEVDGEPQEFASHLDAVVTTEDGRVVILDWKTGEEGPTWHYLARNMQLALYWLGLRHGTVLQDGAWKTYGDSADVYWVHVRNLSPYGKSGSYVGDGGELVEYKKGDLRPMHKVFQRVSFTDENAIIEEFATRVRMFRAGLFPTNPDPIGCMVCESRKFCPTFTGEVNGNV